MKPFSVCSGMVFSFHRYIYGMQSTSNDKYVINRVNNFVTSLFFPAIQMLFLAGKRIFVD